MTDTDEIVAPKTRGAQVPERTQPGATEHDSAVHQGLDVSFEDHYQAHYEEELVTGLLHRAVPACERAGLRFTVVQDGLVEMLLPLNVATTNQHGTHQATIMALAGDYTGGCALGSVLRGVPLVGIHPIHGGERGCLWLAKFEMTYHAPSSTDVTVRATVPREKYDTIRSRFWAGEPTLLPLQVKFLSERDELLAEGRFVYYLRHADYITPREAGKAGGVMHQHMLKASARLIANVRARENDAEAPLYRDPYSRNSAGKHGELLGDRFLELLPELGQMVAARTRSADDCLRHALEGGVEQVVLVGAGLDFRPHRFASEFPDVRYFELDLPEMIAERERVITAADLPAVDRTTVPINLLFESPADVLADCEGFDVNSPIFVVYEGCSMYFEDDTAHAILAGLGELVGWHPESRLWFDLVSEAVGSGIAENASIRAFLDGMAVMGEPFVFGHDDPAALLADAKLEVASETPSDAYRPELTSQIYDHYRFVLAEPSTAH